MRSSFLKKRSPHLRDASSLFQYQALVRYRPCVVSKPRAWMSLMNTRRPASFMVLVTPNSLAALTELTKSPPALASASTCALDAWACSRNEEKSDAPRSEEHTSELQSLMRISYAVFCL